MVLKAFSPKRSTRAPGYSHRCIVGSHASVFQAIAARTPSTVPGTGVLRRHLLRWIGRRDEADVMEQGQSRRQEGGEYLCTEKAVAKQDSIPGTFAEPMGQQCDVVGIHCCAGRRLPKMMDAALKLPSIEVVDLRVLRQLGPELLGPR